jgi:hypothetical protein
LSDCGLRTEEEPEAIAAHRDSRMPSTLLPGRLTGGRLSQTDLTGTGVEG